MRQRGGEAAMRVLLALSLAERPTATFCANDLLALGAHKTYMRLGVSIPHAMSLVGCDDIAFAQLVTPELTTLAVPVLQGVLEHPWVRRARRLAKSACDRNNRRRSIAAPIRWAVPGHGTPRVEDRW